MRWRICWLLPVAMLLVGCGGSGSSGPPSARLAIYWPARSRDVNAVSSAVMAEITLKKARADGTDLTFKVLRDSDPAAYRKEYLTPEPVKPGEYELIALFHPYPNADDSYPLAEAHTTVQVKADGSIPTAIDTVGRLRSVELEPGSVVVGSYVDPMYAAISDQGVAPVQPGALFFHVVSGEDKLKVVNGLLMGVTPGIARVNLTIDGKTSREVEITVSDIPRYTVNLIRASDATRTGTVMLYDINNLGEFVGFLHNRINNFSEIHHAYLWSVGGAQELDVTDPVAINDSQVIVASGGAIIDHGQYTSLDGTMHSQPVDINNLGHVAGGGDFTSSGERAFLWKGGSDYTDLGTGRAVAINNNDQIVGIDGGRVWFWTNGSRTDLGPGSASDMNDAGVIVGASGGRAVKWQNGQLLALPLPPGTTESSASGINNKGQIVGVYNVGTGSRACLWDGGPLTDLSFVTPGLTTPLVEARRINDRGQILCRLNRIDNTINTFYTDGLVLTPK